MATNPMQRKARNSFLLGMLLMFLIAAIVIAFLVMQLMNERKKQEQIAKAKTNVYVITQDIKEGGTVPLESIQKMAVDKSLVPSDAVGEEEDLIKLLDLEVNEIGELKEKKDNKNLTAKIDLKANTVITKQMFSRNDIKDVRKQEYNMVILPTDLETGDFVDIRLMMPSGQDYIVISKKEVTIPDAGGTLLADTIWMNMREDEILTMSSAIVEAYMVNGAKLYATKYVDPAVQEKSTPNYLPNAEVDRMFTNNPNILEEASEELNKRYSTTNTALRNDDINEAIREAGEEGLSNIQSKTQESITNTKTTRKQYLDSLTGIVE